MSRFGRPIDSKRRDEIVNAIAERVRQFGVIVPAIFFLEMHKPLSYVGGQAMHFFAPIVGTFFETFEDYAYFFDDRNNVELLIQRLEAIALEEERADKGRKSQSKKKVSAIEESMKIDRDSPTRPQNL